MILAQGPLIGPADVPLDVTVAPGRSGPGQAPETLRMDLNQASDRFERIIVQRILEEVLGLHRNSLRRRLRDVQGPEIELAGLVRKERVLAAGFSDIRNYPPGSCLSVRCSSR